MAVTARGCVTAPHGRVHFRYGGRGPVVVMLPDAPRSSAAHRSHIEWLGEQFTIIALDLPGCGNSSPLPLGQAGIADYSRALADTLTALGIDRCAVYGFRSGARIALEFAAQCPARAALTVLDGLSLTPEAPTDEWLQRLLPVIEPRPDGSHLAALWTRVVDGYRYQPWFTRSARTRIAAELPDAESLHELAVDEMLAGPHGTSIRIATLGSPAEPPIRALRAPTAFLWREDDPGAAHIDRLPQPLPSSCRVERVPPDSAAWRVKMLELLRRARLPDSGWSAPRGPADAPDGERQQYVDLLHGEVRVRMRGAAGQPVLLLHEVPGSSAETRDLASQLSADRLTVAPDLPGLGESQPLPYPSLGAYVTLLGEVLEQLGLPAVDVVARGLATPFAIALAAHRPQHVRRLVLDAVPWVRTRERGAILRRYCPPIAFDRHGAYLQTLWHQLRDAEASWPWFDRSAAAARIHDPDLDPSRLQAALVDVLQQLPSYGDAAKAALAAAVREIVPTVKQPVLLLHDASDVRYRGTMRVLKRLAHGRRLTRPATDGGRAHLLREFLG